MRWVKAIGELLGGVFIKILPWLAKESRKPREVKTVGHDPAVSKDIDKSIERNIEKRARRDS